jgi:hypothetical protein
VLDVTIDRWHHSQSDADRRINSCAKETELERFLWEERCSLFGFVW